MANQSKKLVGLRDSFQGAREYQQIEGLQSQVEQLEAEIAGLRKQELNNSEQSQLEQQITELTAQLAAQTGVHEIAVSKIDRDPIQPRTVFPPLLVQERAESLRSKGQLTPIIVIPIGDRYKLFEGEIRWQAAQKLGWEKLQAVFLTSKESLNDADIFERQVVTSIQSQQLHDLDIAEAIIKLAIDRHPHLATKADEIPKILYAALRRMERGNDNPDFNSLKIADTNTQQTWLDSLDGKEEEKQIFQVILGLQLHPATISKHILPLLKVGDDVKAAIRDFGIEGSKARVIDRLNVEHLDRSTEDALITRAETIRQIVEGKLSLSETRNLVDGIISSNAPKLVTKSNRVSQVTGKVSKLLTDIQTVEELSELEDALKKIQKSLKMRRAEFQQPE
jgi:ParB family transcriptional regulator, chromosome partitioning protein